MEFVRLSVEGPIATLTVDRPQARNALNSQTLRELLAAVDRCAGEPGVRALIVTGAGDKAFVAGADIAEMAAYSPAQALAFARLGHRAMAALEALPFPTIAAVNGYALGGGCELALACDLTYASADAKLGLPEVGLGVLPGFGGTQRLARRVGRARAQELIFTGRVLGATEAQAVGLVLDVVAPAELMGRCRQVASTIATRAPLAVAQAKRVIHAGADVSVETAHELERQAFGVLFGTADQREGMAAFLEKRVSIFRGT